MIGGDTRSLFFSPFVLVDPNKFSCMLTRKGCLPCLPVCVGTRRECETRGRRCERDVWAINHQQLCPNHVFFLFHRYVFVVFLSEKVRLK